MTKDDEGSLTCAACNSMFEKTGQLIPESEKSKKLAKAMQKDRS